MLSVRVILVCGLMVLLDSAVLSIICGSISCSNLVKCAPMDWCSCVERDWEGLRAVEFRGWRLWSEGLLVEWIGRVEG